MDAIAFEASAVFDGQRLAGQFAVETTTGHDGQLAANEQSDEFAGYEQMIGFCATVQSPFFADRYGLGDVEVSIDEAVDMDISGTPDFATDFTTDRNNCFRAMSVLRRSTSAKDPHGTCFSLVIT